MTRTLLLNWVYYNPVGHVVEGMKIARGYHAANRGVEVHMMVNADAPALFGLPDASAESPRDHLVAEADREELHLFAVKSAEEVREAGDPGIVVVDGSGGAGGQVAVAFVEAGGIVAAGDVVVAERDLYVRW